MGQHSVFVTLRGDRFIDLDLPGRAWTLAEVSELRHLAGCDSYAIELTTETVEPAPQQGMLALEHAHLGRLDVFVVPIAPGRVEAVFNDLATADRAADATADRS